MMDQLFTSIIGKPTLNPPKIITIVAENFSLLEDQARFLKAILALPEVKQLPLRGDTAKLIQIGPLPIDIEEQVRKAKWTIDLFDNLETNKSICDHIEESLLNCTGRKILFLNDASRLELSSNDPKEAKKLVALVYRLKQDLKHSVIVLYQNSTPNNTSRLLRDLQYISDGVSRVHSCKAGYFSSIWYQKDVLKAMLLPMKVETYYHTCKIGKFYWSQDLLCFHECKQVPKNYDLENDTYLDISEETDTNLQKTDFSVDDLNDSMRSSRLDDFEDDGRDSTLPYTAAQDPQKSRIFYYPDKEDDIDEDDPDNDLAI